MKRKLSDDSENSTQQEDQVNAEHQDHVATYYTVEKVIKTRIINGKKECLIKWLGYNHAWNTWEPEENIKTEIYDDSSVNDEESEEKDYKKATKKRMKRKKKEQQMPITYKKTPIIVNHKISKKRLEAILAKHRLAKMQSNLISVETRNAN